MDCSLIPKDVEIYSFNIGEIILNTNKDYKFIQILFSADTNLFLKEIILICFEYIRFTKRKASDFIKELNRNNSIIMNEEPIQNFNFIQEEDNINFFTNENIKKNKDKFIQM